MKTFTASTTINAEPAKVWAILTDVARYPEWDQAVDRIEGKILLGQSIKVITKASPDRAFPVKVTRFLEGRGMTWQGGLPLGLFKGVRTFDLTRTAGGTEVKLQEVFSGPLLPLIGRTLPDFNPIFIEFLAALKRRAESS